MVNKFAANLVNHISLEGFCNGEYESGKNYLKYFSFFNPLEAEHGSKMPGGGGTPILGHIRDVRPEWVTFPGRKPADGCKFLTKNLRMGHNFDIILPGNGWFSPELNKTYCSLVNFYCK